VSIIRTSIEARQATVLTGGVRTTTSAFQIYTFNDSGTIGWS
jgi:hypothetical protein